MEVKLSGFKKVFGNCCCMCGEPFQEGDVKYSLLSENVTIDVNRRYNLSKEEIKKIKVLAPEEYFYYHKKHEQCIEKRQREFPEVTWFWETAVLYTLFGRFK